MIHNHGTRRLLSWCRQMLGIITTGSTVLLLSALGQHQAALAAESYPLLLEPGPPVQIRMGAEKDVLRYEVIPDASAEKHWGAGLDIPRPSTGAATVDDTRWTSWEMLHQLARLPSRPYAIRLDEGELRILYCPTEYLEQRDIATQARIMAFDAAGAEVLDVTTYLIDLRTIREHNRKLRQTDKPMKHILQEALVLRHPMAKSASEAVSRVVIIFQIKDR